jgi:hypothetical protein
VANWNLNANKTSCHPNVDAVCIFAFYNRNGPNGWHREIAVYDRYCRQIGGILTAPESGTFDVPVQLPYTISADFGNRQFHYATNTDTHTCVTYQDKNGAPLPAADIDQCAFNCGAGPWNNPQTVDATTDGSTWTDVSPVFVRDETRTNAIGGVRQNADTEASLKVEPIIYGEPSIDPGIVRVDGDTEASLKVDPLLARQDHGVDDRDIDPILARAMH